MKHKRTKISPKPRSKKSPNNNKKIDSKSISRTNDGIFPGILSPVVVPSDKPGKAKIKVRQSDQYRDLVEKFSDGIMIVGMDGRVHYASPSLERVLGNPAKDLVDKNALKALRPDSMGKVDAFVRKLLKTQGVVIHEEFKARHKSGSWRDLDVTGINHFNDPRVKGLVLNFRDITERRSAEKALRGSEELFRSLTENSHDVISLVGADGLVRYISPSQKKVLGYDPTELTGKKMDVLIHPDDLDRLHKIFRSFIQRVGETITVDVRAKHKDGSWRVMEATAINHLNNPAVHGIIVTHRDITDRKLTQDAIKASEEKFRALIEKSHEGVKIVGPDTLVRYVSPSVQGVLGYVPEDLLGKSCFEILHPEDREMAKAFFQELAGMPGIAKQGELRALHKDGSWRTLEITGTNHFNEPMVGGLVLNYRDITEVKKTREELRQSEEKFRTLIENSNDVLAVINLRAEVKYVSPSVKYVLGYSPEELAGHRDEDFIHPDDRDVLGKIVEVVTANPGKAIGFELRGKHKNGSWRRLEGTITNLLNNLPVMGFGAVFRDVTEKRRAEEEVVKSEKRFRSLIEHSHDLIQIWGPKGERLYESPTIERLLGYRPGERRGSAMDAGVTSDDDKAQKFLKHILAAPGLPLRAEIKARHKDGHFIDMEVVATNLLHDPAVGGIVVNSRNIAEKKLAEEALVKSEEKFRSLIEKSYDGIHMVDAQGKLLYVSPAIKKILGFDPEERIGRSFLELQPKEDREGVRREFERFVQNVGGTGTIRVRVRHKDGSLRYLEVAGTNLLNHPAIQGIVFNYRDMTEGILAEESIRQSEEKFRNLLEMIPYGIWVHRQKKITYINEAALRILGYRKAGELIGKESLELVHPEERDAAKKRIDHLKPGEHNPSVERRFLRKNGETVYTEVMSLSILSEGQPAVLVVIRDLTERKKNEAELRRSEENFRSLVENSPDAILIHWGEVIYYANPSFLKLTGYATREEVIGQPWDFHLHPDEKNAVHNRIKNAMELGEFNPPAERKVVRKDGSVVLVESLSFGIQYGTEKMTVAVLRDLSERKNAEQAVMKFERLSTIGEMAAALAHEIRNPLSGISLSAQYLQRKFGSQPEVVEQAKNVLEQSERLKKLVDDTLDYAQDRPAEEKMVKDTRDLMALSLRQAQVQFGPKHANFQVRWEFERDQFHLFVNPYRIQQILSNLILNAFQAMGENGILTLKCWKNEKDVYLAVQDDGPGVNDEALSRLFEPFFTTKSNGSGLGLSVSRKIAESHGGDLKVERLRPKGTVFVLRIPCEKGKPA